MRLLPKLHAGEFAFVSVPHGTDPASLADLEIIATMREDEGLTLVLPVAQAEQRGYPVLLRTAWITLSAETALDAVGITATFARALADAGIACNVVAGAHHDHLFVPVELAERAMQTLNGLQRRG